MSWAQRFRASCLICELATELLTAIMDAAASYALLVLGGKAAPSADEVKAVNFCVNFFGGGEPCHELCRPTVCAGQDRTDGRTDGRLGYRERCDATDGHRVRRRSVRRGVLRGMLDANRFQSADVRRYTSCRS